MMQIFPTRMCNVTAWRHSRLLAHWLMALQWRRAEGGLQRLLSLIGYGSTWRVCGRSLMAGKILFTGRQTCSLYLVLWLCGKLEVKIYSCFFHKQQREKQLRLATLVGSVANCHHCVRSDDKRIPLNGQKKTYFF